MEQQGWPGAPHGPGPTPPEQRPPPQAAPPAQVWQELPPSPHALGMLPRRQFSLGSQHPVQFEGPQPLRPNMHAPLLHVPLGPLTELQLLPSDTHTQRLVLDAVGQAFDAHGADPAGDPPGDPAQQSCPGIPQPPAEASAPTHAEPLHGPPLEGVPPSRSPG